MVVCAFANSPLSSSLVLYHSAAVGEPLPFSPVSSLWEPTFLKGGRRGERGKRRSGREKKRKGEGRGCSSRKERKKFVPHSYSLLLLPSPPPPQIFLTLAFTEDRGLCFLILVLLAIPSAGFQPLFPIPSPLPSYVCRPFTPILDLLRGKKKGGRGRTSQLTAFPQPFSLLFLQMATGRNLHLKEKGGRGRCPLREGGGLSLAGGFFSFGGL